MILKWFQTTVLVNLMYYYKAYRSRSITGSVKIFKSALNNAIHTDDDLKSFCMMKMLPSYELILVLAFVYVKDQEAF